jgi:L-fuconolactonase
LIIDTHVHAFTDDRKNYPQIGDTARAGSIPSVTELGQSEWPVTPVESLIRMMDDAGIDKATLVQAYYVYEYDNRYTMDAVRAYKDRFVAVCIVDPMDPAAPDQLSRLVEEEGAVGVRYMRGRLPESALGKQETFPLWARIEQLGIPITITDRIGEIAKTRRTMEKYPGVKVAFDHGWGHEVGLPPYTILKPLFDFADNPNVYVKTAVNNIDASVQAGGSSQEFYEKLLGVFGAKRIMWSSNYPAHPRLGSLKSRVEACQKAFAFMSEEDRRWIFSDTALSVWPSLQGGTHRVQAR